MARGPKAELLLRERLQLTADVFVEMVIWRVPMPVAGSVHGFKYRLALIRAGACVVRYDNEAGKGDHKHVGDDEVAYEFLDIDLLQADFWSDVDRRLKQ